MKIIGLVAFVLALGSIGCDASPSRCAHVAAPVSLDGPRSLSVRAEAGSLWAGAGVWSGNHRAWTMPARGPVENMAIRALSNGGYEVTFLQGGVAWSGDLDADRKARGPLRPLPGPMPADERITLQNASWSLR